MNTLLNNPTDRTFLNTVRIGYGHYINKTFFCRSLVSISILYPQPRFYTLRYTTHILACQESVAANVVQGAGLLIREAAGWVVGAPQSETRVLALKFDVQLVRQCQETMPSSLQPQIMKGVPCLRRQGEMKLET